MRTAVAVAAENALPSAFVVFRGIEESIRKAAGMGYDGVELALMDKQQVDICKVKRLIREYGLKIPAISSGQVFAGSGLCFTNPDFEIRKKAVDVFRGLVETAAEFGAMVNIGRVRGFVQKGETLEIAEDRFGQAVGEISSFAEKLGVSLILEPVNRYELNFINNLDQGAALIDKLGINNLKLMPDLFHMNIEDADMEGSLKKYARHIAYIHLADSNRQAPGWGHICFRSILNTLEDINFKGWASVEILPEPDPDSAARQAIDYLGSLYRKMPEDYKTQQGFT